MVRSKAVLEPGVICAWINKACKSELLNPAQSLHLGSIGNLLSKAVQFNKPMHRISNFSHLNK
jgi:hypothetical protein